MYTHTAFRVTGTALVVALAMSVSTIFPNGGSASEEYAQEAIMHRGVTSCGVERWAVKTGTDSGARLVNRNAPFDTAIYRLRNLSAPSSLPVNSRIQPVETTLYRLSATIVRYKIEADSDFHLVLSDSGGRTMIAEIPAPQCVGSNSPFRASIAYVRRTFNYRYHPGDYWQRQRIPVIISGVGFFDFRHGQSGVAPSGIELHPVLAIRYGGSAVVPRHQSPPPPPRHVNPPSTGHFYVSASVSPNPVSYGQYATLTARSIAGASCSGSVVYSTGRPPRSFDGYAQTVDGSGRVSWQWHMESRGSNGTATVTCGYRGLSKSATTTFQIG